MRGNRSTARAGVAAGRGRRLSKQTRPWHLFSRRNVYQTVNVNADRIFTVYNEPYTIGAIYYNLIQRKLFRTSGLRICRYFRAKNGEERPRRKVTPRATFVPAPLGSATTGRQPIPFDQRIHPHRTVPHIRAENACRDASIPAQAHPGPRDCSFLRLARCYELDRG